MTTEQATGYLQALAASLTIGVIVPLLILGLMVVAAWVLLSRANRDPTFNVVDVFRDENQKVSSERVLLFATWGSSTWALAVVIFAMPQHTVDVMLIYMGAWGTNNAAKAFFRSKYPAPDQKEPPP